jgi:hypothetical protein
LRKAGTAGAEDDDEMGAWLVRLALAFEDEAVVVVVAEDAGGPLRAARRVVDDEGVDDDSAAALGSDRRGAMATQTQTAVYEP